MGIAIKCALCGTKTHRQVKRVPVCRECKDKVVSERDRLKSEMVKNIKDIEQRKQFLQFTNTRSALGNLLNSKETTDEE